MSNVVSITTPENVRRLSNRFIQERLSNDRHEIVVTEERDQAEQAFISVFRLVVGKDPAFSDTYGYKEALLDIRECLGVPLSFTDEDRI